MTKEGVKHFQKSVSKDKLNLMEHTKPFGREPPFMALLVQQSHLSSADSWHQCVSLAHAIIFINPSLRGHEKDFWQGNSVCLHSTRNPIPAALRCTHRSTPVARRMANIVLSAGAYCWPEAAQQQSVPRAAPADRVFAGNLAVGNTSRRGC